MNLTDNDFVERLSIRHQNEPEFLQAVWEVTENLLPFIEKNPFVFHGLMTKAW